MAAWRDTAGAKRGADARRWASSARDDARTILTRMLLAVNPQTLLRRRVRFDAASATLTLPDGRPVPLPRGRTRLLAMGKAAGGLAAHAQPWGPFVEAVVVAPYDAGIPEFECLVGDHPEPTERGVAAGERALELAAATGPDEVLLLLLSGGASALAEAPAVPLDDLRRVTQLLLRSGADVAELNIVRRHLSRLKGGGLLRATRGRIVVLAISDVEGDDPAALGSGPAAADATTYADALRVLREHDLLDVAPRSVVAHLRAGDDQKEPETVKPGDAALARVTACVLAGNEDALREGARVAGELGYHAIVRPESLRGEARACGRRLAEEARAIAAGDARYPSLPSGRPVALFAGGETTVRVTGSGRGGRNQEVALAAVDGLSALDAVLACVGTDGVDGPTDAAGAIVDGTTRARADALGLDAAAHLQENDAYAYFDALHDLVRTGPTGTNVRDVAVVLIRPHP
jgi:glycerate-2-kinase